MFRNSVLIVLTGLSLLHASAGEPMIQERIVIDNVWSPVSVGFCLLTDAPRQYVAYYNADRRMVVGMRDFSASVFTLHVLPSESDQPPRASKKTSTIQGWDSHNYITMAIDAAGYIHLSGNMHADPLLYFRSEKPHDISTMKQVFSMVGKNEVRCTYPKFMRTPDGQLLFHYRDGGSGRGNEIYNVYDTKTKEWRRFLDTPLLDGEGKMNAYQRGPVPGPDGWYRLAWMWRDTPDAATNHDISYARSKDLIHWENASGESLQLPIRISSSGTIIDPVPPGGGMINSCFDIGFDSRQRVVVTYHKHDESGNTQAYAARYADGRWFVKPVSNWVGQHVFKGGGSGPSTFGTSLSLGRLAVHSEGQLALPYRHWKAGHGLLLFDEETFSQNGSIPDSVKTERYPASLKNVVSDFPGMRVRWREDSGASGEVNVRYVLRWETLGSNRDRPRDKPWPENSDLVLLKLVTP